jgi:hypothetical protein
MKRLDQLKALRFKECADRLLYLPRSALKLFRDAVLEDVFEGGPGGMGEGIGPRAA